MAFSLPGRAIALLTGVLLPAAAMLAAPASAPLTTSTDEAMRLYAAQVRPLLSRRCIGCHSANSGKPQGGLALDTPAGWRRGGASGAAVVPGKPDESLLIEAVRYRHASLRMPPSGKLPQEEIDLLADWVRRGAPAPAAPTPERKDAGRKTQHATRAPEQGWWAVRPLARPDPPRVKAAWWPRTPVDRFIQAKLEAQGLKPSAYADRRTLIRRAYFDLIGLPPTPEEVDRFLADRSPTAWEKVVDRLLASPAYGERWGRHWLDVAHYGDTHGYDKDKRRDHAWPYRDYVIRSFNSDKPYARFIREQIAGDVLYPGEPDGVVATGFIAAGPWDFVGHVELREGTVEKEKTRVLDRDDMVANAISTFNSVTIHCARCHDHKFDPIPQRDYYRLQAVFSGVERGDRSYYDAGTARRKAVLEQQRAEWLGKQAALVARAAATANPELARLDAELESLRGRIAALPPAAGEPDSPTNGWHSGIEPRADVEKWVQVDLGRRVPLEGIRLFPARPTDFRDTPGFGFPVRFRVSISDDPAFAAAETIASHTGADYPNPGDASYLVPLAGREARYVRVTATRLWPRTNDFVFALAELEVYSGARNVARGAAVTSTDSIESGRWSRRALTDGNTSRSRIPDAADAHATERGRLEAQYREREQSRGALFAASLDPVTREGLGRAADALAGIERDLASIPPPQQVYAVLPRAPRPIRLLARGDVERPLDPVGPGALSCVSGLPAAFSAPDAAEEGRRRAALAGWLSDRRNPLTWRSIVNRVWHYHFGRGLVDTPNDFGMNGSLPSHPELLDWLAATFVAVQSPESKVQSQRSPKAGDSGLRSQDLGLNQSLKALHRLLMTSAVYMQSSSEAPAPARTHPKSKVQNPKSVDSDNRLLWRMNRRRLDAEAIRDSVLAISGKLDRTMGGPAYALFRFKDDHSPVYDYTAPELADDPKTFRRTVYRFTVRSVQNPFLESLDCADPSINTPVRNTTLTALQALALLNNPFMVRQSEHLAERLATMSDTPEGQVEAAYRLALSRPPDAEEKTAMAAYVRKHGLANGCRLILNANEFVFVD